MRHKHAIAAALSIGALAVPAVALGTPGNGNGNGNGNGHGHGGGYTENPGKGHGPGGGNSGQGGGNSANQGHNGGQGGSHAAPQAGDHPGSGGQGNRHDPIVAYVFKGTYTGVGTTGAATVDVDHGNSFVRRHGLIGGTVEFDLSAARLSVADTSGDGTVALDDVIEGDRVLVKAKLHKRDPGSQPFGAKRLVDQTNPAPED